MIKHKSFKALAFFTGLFLAFSLSAQTAIEQIEEDPVKAGGVMNLYDFDITSHAVAPEGYKPFYISHFGRHGARYASSSKVYPVIFELFEDASKKGLLTAQGEAFWKKYEEMYPSLANRAGDLSAVGQEQERLIAERMYKAYPEVFEDSAKVDARSTYVPRCVMTMIAFCDKLKAENPSLDIVKTTSYTDMGFMNPTSIYNPDVKKTDEGLENSHAVWNDALNSFKAEKLHPEKLFSQFFTNLDFLKEHGSPAKLENYFYLMAVSMPCVGYPNDFAKMIPFDELFALWECSNYMYYLSKGPDGRQGGRQWAFSWRLLDNIISLAESDISTGKYCARLRFGHDITLMNIMALLDVKGWCEPVSDADSVKDVWQDFRVPMASNMQFVFYRNSSGDVMVRLMYNDQDVTLPIESVSAPYYSMADFTRFCEDRIAAAKNIIKNTKAPK